MGKKIHMEQKYKQWKVSLFHPANSPATDNKYYQLKNATLQYFFKLIELGISHSDIKLTIHLEYSKWSL